MTAVTQHNLKTWPKPFEEAWKGKKRHEVRKNDRNFRVGDLLALYEWDPVTEKPLSRVIYGEITYISEPGTFGLPSDVCVFSFSTSLRSDCIEGLSI